MSDLQGRAGVIEERDRFGTLDDGRLLIDGERHHRVSPGDVCRVDMLAVLARTHRLRRIAVAPSAHEWLGLPSRAPERTDPRHGFAHTFAAPTFYAGAKTWPEALGPHVAVQLPSERHRYVIDFPAFDPASPFHGLAGANDLHAALLLFRDSVGVSWRGSAGPTAEAVIASTHPPERGGVQLRRAPDPPAPARIGTTEAAFTWCRPQRAEERRARFVHAFDVNGQYLAAWSSLDCGLDDVQHHDLSTASVDPLLRLPGYFLARLLPVFAHGTLLPHPSNRRAPRPKSWTPARWYHTETMRLARELGVIFSVTEAYVWNRHTRYLSGAYERLRDARTALASAGAPSLAGAARDAVKRLYQVEYGRFAAGFRFEKPDRWLRPDWRHGTIARARANLYRRLAKIHADDEAVAPFAILVDACYFATDEPEPIAFASRVGIPLGDGLGRFKIAGTVANAPELSRPTSAAHVARFMREARAA